MVDLSRLPDNPGCYQFKDKSGKIIYVGKAKNLKKRVSSYFQKKNHDLKTQVLVENIVSYDFIVTDNESEAFLLENNLIKKYRPKYNINLKDSKRYAYIMITKENFPRLILSRKKSDKGTLYGPFVSAARRDYIIKFLRKTFKLRTCRTFPKRPCLRYHLGLCDAPCIGLINKKDYDHRIDRIKFILKGKTSQLIKQMTSDMKKASEEKKFEQAIVLRDEIEAISWLNEKQKMEREKEYDEDMINYLVKDDKVYLMLFNVHHGLIENKIDFVFDYYKNFLEDFITQYYSENNVPKKLIIPEETEESVEGFLSEKKGSKVIVHIPKNGEYAKLLDLIKKNIEIRFFRNDKTLSDLKDKLRLKKRPKIIECFDISHLSGTSMVASMVQFRNGRPKNSNYRRFKIRTVEGIDDFRSIAEVVRRRYTRLLKEDSEFPDLIVVDGGKGQLTFANNELKKLGIKIPIISIAKKHEEIFVPGLKNPLNIQKETDASKLIQQIRDEAHRFAITYNRLLRKKKLLGDEKNRK